MTQYTSAEILIKSLHEENVEHIFGYPGGSILDIYDALFNEEKIKHILVRHEQAASHMADGYTRATGKVPVILVTSGPGATNCITGIATAYMDSIPMVVLSGQVPTHLIGDDAFQETDMVGISRPIVKHSFTCQSPEEIPMLIKKAFYIATSGRPGPIVIDLPKDIQNPEKKYNFQYPKKIDMPSYHPNTESNNRQIKKIITQIKTSKRPILYTGGGIIHSEASKELIKLAEKYNIPVTSTLMGLGAFPGNHKLFLGMLGMHGTYEANSAMHEADLIIALGARFDDRVTNNTEKFCPKATIIHIDIDPSSISKVIKADIPVVADLKQALTGILSNSEIIETPKRTEWWARIQQFKDKKSLSYHKKKDQIQPQEVIEAIYKITKGEAIITSDVGQHQMFAALYYPFKQPRQWINSGGLGTMGFGFPAAIGAKIAKPNKEVVCITGDGSIQMNIQELSTCAQYNIPIKIVLLNNQSLGMVKQWQEMFYEERRSHSYMDSLPNFKKVAEAYNHIGIDINHPDELNKKLTEAFEIKDKLVFINIKVNKEEHIYPMQIKKGAINDMILQLEGQSNAK